MPLDVTLTLSDDDLAWFRSVIQRVREHAGARDDAETARAATRVVARLRGATRSPYILRRLDRVARLVEMLHDPAWQLPDPERRRVMECLAYLADSQDIVPDDVPVLGLLDDAIVLELLLADLRHELEAYEEFVDYRATESMRAAGRTVSRDEWLDAKRQALQGRMRERRQRDIERLGGALEPITLF
jgi:uncharacterized membrane protein YkvA (DUF1232 family)